MLQYSRWTAIMTVVICFLGLAYAAPNVMSDSFLRSIPTWLPHQKMNLGLDLQGGSHLLLEVDGKAVVKDMLDSIVSELRRELQRTPRVNYVGLGVDSGAVVFELRDMAQSGIAQERARTVAKDLDLTSDGPKFRITVSEQAAAAKRQSALEQSIEVVRRRVDETGVAEPTIQQQGGDRIVVELPGVGDPDRVKRLLGQTAKLTFHMADPTTSVADAQAGRLPAGSQLIAMGDGTGGQMVIRSEVSVSGERLVDARPDFEQGGQPVVNFRFDAQGGRQFGQVTTENVGKQLAIVLDNKVISAPNIRQPITAGTGIITGGFTVQQTRDLSLLLRAGALPAPLTILEERTVGPSLGADSIAAGRAASIAGFVLVVGFMGVYYNLFGLMAGVALIFNIALLIALLSLFGASLTLPGIAGIVLTMGMAVDANVLIYERIREEVRSGRTPINAIQIGYEKAFITILDTHLTQMIGSLLLLVFGAGPVRGFAITLSLGIAISVFTAVMVTRLMVVYWVRRYRPKVVPV